MKYQVTIPVYVFVVVDVEADNEDEAIDAAVPHVYEEGAGGLACAHGQRLTCAGGRDALDWDRVEVDPA